MEIFLSVPDGRKPVRNPPSRLKISERFPHLHDVYIKSMRVEVPGSEILPSGRHNFPKPIRFTAVTGTLLNLCKFSHLFPGDYEIRNENNSRSFSTWPCSLTGEGTHVLGTHGSRDTVSLCGPVCTFAPSIYFVNSCNMLAGRSGPMSAFCREAGDIFAQMFGVAARLDQLDSCFRCLDSCLVGKLDGLIIRWSIII